MYLNAAKEHVLFDADNDGKGVTPGEMIAMLQNINNR
jgi:hypothetical protein